MSKARRCIGWAASAAISAIVGAGCMAGERARTEVVVEPVTARIQDVAYHAETRLAAFTICRITHGNAREKVCAVGYARLPQPDRNGRSSTVTPQLLTDRPGHTFDTPKISPRGDAIYFTRQTYASWRLSFYDAPSEVVRKDLATGAEFVVSEQAAGIHGVAGVVLNKAGGERVLLFASASPKRHVSSSGHAVVDVSTGGRVSRKTFFDMKSAGDVTTIPGLGVISAIDAGRNESNSIAHNPVAFVSAGGDPDLIISPGLASMLARLANHHKSNVSSSALQKAVTAADLIRRTPTHKIGLGKTDYKTRLADVVVRFEGRVAPFIAQKGAPYGSYLFAADWMGGALAVEPGAHPGDQVPLAIFTGDRIPLRQSGLSLIDCSAFRMLNQKRGVPNV